MAFRKCTVCKIKKPLDSFWNDKTRKLGKKYVCKECSNKYQRSEKYKAYKRTYAKKTACWRASYYKFKFNISMKDYNKLFVKQNGCCAVCGRHQSEFNKRLTVDHNHLTKKIRGLLCEDCNLGIGRLKDSIEILQKAIQYLEDKRK